MFPRALIGCFFLAIFSGCAATRPVGWDWVQPSEPSNVSKAELGKLFTEGKKLWLKRHEKEFLEKSLAKFEVVVEADPYHYKALMLLSRGQFLLAGFHTDNIEEKKLHWSRGCYWGERALATNIEIRRQVTEKGHELEEALSSATRTEVDALYWMAINLGEWSRSSGTATSLKNRSLVKALIKRVEELDPGYYYGAIYRYWGAYYAAAPFFAGGSMDKSLGSFQRSFQVANEYLGSHVAFAESYATRKGDRELFRQELERVLLADVRSLPDVVPEQVLEKKKAEKMLSAIEDYF